MKRDTLYVYLRRLVIASLPLAGSGCSPAGGTGGIGGHCRPTHYTYQLVFDGGLPDGLVLDDAGCETICSRPVDSCEGSATDGGVPAVSCHATGYCAGRRSFDTVIHALVEPNRLAALFSSMAELEAASVPAFRRLQSELVAHGAPAALVARAAEAELDEVRHVEIMARLAAHFGSQRDRRVLPSVKAHPTRSLVELACENAAEGCVRETYGALVAAWQAETAVDPAVRRSMHTIARDESRHAELAWAIDRWVAPHLDEREREQVNAARKDAVGELARELAVAPAEEVQKQAGAPTAEQALMLAAQLSRAIWA